MKRSFKFFVLCRFVAELKSVVMKKRTLLISAFMLTAATMFAEPWQVGYPNPASVTATFSGNTLTISGKGAMMDFEDYYYAPWYSIRSSIKNLVIGEGATAIGDWAFSRCEGLSTVILPESLTTIGVGAFSNCEGLSSITLPKKLTAIGAGAFYYCFSLSGTLIIPEGVTSIENETFRSCYGLSALIIPEGVKSIGNFAFAHCSGLKGTLTIPEGVTEIGDWAFRSCDNLTSIILPKSKSLKSIGDCAFEVCSGLSGSLTISAGVMSIGEKAFARCHVLSAINVHTGNAYFSSVDGILYDKAQTTVIQCPAGKTGTVTIPDGVKTIGNHAFEDCMSLISIILPKSITSIGDEAFFGCDGLSSVTNLADEPQNINSDVFRYLTLSDITLYVPEASLAKYQKADVWKEFKIEAVTGIQNLCADEAVAVGFYTLTGVKLPQEPESGTYIVVYDKGKRVVSWR